MKSKVKLFFIVCILGVAFSIFNSDTLSHIGEKLTRTKVYDVDFTKQYKRTLDAMFENNWTVKSKKEKTEEPEETCDCGIEELTPIKYTEWTLQYTDEKGELQEFILNNKDQLSNQIENYIEDYIPQFYEKHFFNEYLKDIPLKEGSYVYGFLDRVSTNPQAEENKVWVSTVEKYRKSLETPEGTICFSKLTPANAFEMCPMYLSINISIDDGKYSALDKQNLEEHTRKQVDLMIAAMNSFANNKFNAEISVSSNQENDALYDGNLRWVWNYIQGTAKNIEYPWYFDREVHNSYKGLFW